MATMTVDRRDGLNGGLGFKAPVRVATTVNTTLSGLQSIDGVTLVDDDRVLVKDQTEASENGVYNASSGVWPRAKDFDGNRDIVKGSQVYVAEGDENGTRTFAVTAGNPITIGTTAITFGAVSSQNAVYSYSLKADVEAALIPATVTSLVLAGHTTVGKGAARYKRVASAPTHGGKIRSADRYLPDGTASDENGGWWEIAETKTNILMFGAVAGDISKGSTNHDAMVASEAYDHTITFPDNGGVFTCDQYANTTTLKRLVMQPGSSAVPSGSVPTGDTAAAFFAISSATKVRLYGLALVASAETYPNLTLIEIGGSSGVIERCTLSGGKYGIYAGNCTNLTNRNNDISGYTQRGIACEGSAQFNVKSHSNVIDGDGSEAHCISAYLGLNVHVYNNVLKNAGTFGVTFDHVENAHEHHDDIINSTREAINITSCQSFDVGNGSEARWDSGVSQDYAASIAAEGDAAAYGRFHGFRSFGNKKAGIAVTAPSPPFESGTDTAIEISGNIITNCCRDDDVGVPRAGILIVGSGSQIIRVGPNIVSDSGAGLIEHAVAVADVSTGLPSRIVVDPRQTTSGLSGTPIYHIGELSVAISGDEDNYSPAGLTEATALVISADQAGRVLTGLDAAALPLGKVLTLRVAGDYAVTLAHESSSSSAGNQFNFAPIGLDLIVAVGQEIQLRVDTTLNKVRPAGPAFGDIARIKSAGSSYTVIRDAGGHNALLLGDADTPVNRYRNATHSFESYDGETVFGTWDAEGLAGAKVKATNGTVARTLETRFNDAATVKDVGAIGTGDVADVAANNTALQAAIDAAKVSVETILANKIGIVTAKVRIPAGHYVFDATLLVPSGVRIEGDGEGNTLLDYVGSDIAISIDKVSTEELFAVQFSGFTLRNSGTGTRGISGDDGSALAIRSCSITNVVVTDFDINVYLNESWAFNIADSELIFGNTNNLHMKNATHLRAERTRFDVAGEDSVYVTDGSTGTETMAAKFDTCSFQSANKWGLHCVDVVGLTLINAFCESNNQNASGVYGAVYFEDGPNTRGKKFQVIGGFFTPGTGTSGQTAIKIDRATDVSIDTHVRGSAITTAVSLGANVLGGRVFLESNGPATAVSYAGTGPLLQMVNGQMSGIPRFTSPLMNYGGYKFSGTNYLNGNALTGIADSKKGTFVCILRFANAASVAETLWSSTSTKFQVQRSASGNISVSGRNAANTQILNQITSGSPCSAAGTYVLMLSWDLAVPGSMRCYINGASKTMTSTLFTDDLVDLTTVEHSVGASTTGTSPFTGDMYLVYLDASSWLDFSSSTVRGAFRDMNNVPLFLGPNGALPNDAQPHVLLAYSSYTGWPANKGSLVASAFTEQGTPGVVGTKLFGQYGVFAPLTTPLMSYGGYHFDGSTNYLDGNALTGIADGKKGTFACIVRFENAASVAETIFSSTSTKFQVQRSASGNISLAARNSANTQILNQITSGAPCAAAGTYTIMLSWDLATAGSMRCFINDISRAVTSTTFTDDTIDNTTTEYIVGGNTGGTSLLAGDIYELYYDATTNLDFASDAVRRTFIDASNVPQFPGAIGEIPSGAQPQLFLAYSPFTTWPANKGSLVATTFTEHGTPALVTTKLSGQYGAF